MRSSLGQRAAVFVLLAMGGAPASSSGATITFRNGQSPQATYAGARDIRIDNSGIAALWQPNVPADAGFLSARGATVRRAVLMRWDLPGIPATAFINSVSLTLNVTDPSADTYPVYSATRHWVDAQASWVEATANQP